MAEMALRRERVAERLKELRELNGLSQELAAQKVGITHRQWQRWEQGESVPYPRNLDVIASRFGISISEFFDEEPPAALAKSSQLDRIEAKLDELLSRLPAEGLAEVLEQEARRTGGQPERTAGGSARKPRSRKAS